MSRHATETFTMDHGVLLRSVVPARGKPYLHVCTQKGRGRQYAVEDPCRFHSPSAYTVLNGQAVFESKARPTWTQTFSDALVELAAKALRSELQAQFGQFSVGGHGWFLCTTNLKHR